MQAEGTRSLKVALGGEILSFAPCGNEIESVLGECYVSFASTKPPSVTFRVHAGPIPYPNLGSPAFSTERWALHRVQGKLVVCIRHPRLGMYQLVAIDADSRGGDVYCIDVPWRRGFPLRILDHPTGEVLFLSLLTQGRGVLLHAGGVGQDGQALLFSGMSGDGKSTLIRLWQEHTDATLLSDDRIIVRKQGKRFWAYGTPWHGSVPVMSPESFPLERIYVMHHAPENSMSRLEHGEAVKSLLARSFPPFWDAEGMGFTLAFLDELVRAVPCYGVGFVPDRSAVDFLRCVT
jgi:hypothetical protein